MRKPSPAMLVALAALFVALGGVGVAATGGNFILGNSNTAGNTTTLSSGVTTGPALDVSNTGGKPAARFSAIGTSPFIVSNARKVPNLNADQVDGKDSTAFLPSSGTIVQWYSPFEYRSPQPAVSVSPTSGPGVNVTSSTAGGREVYLSLNEPSILGATLKLKSVTICFWFVGAPITGTAVYDGDGSVINALSTDSYTHSSPEYTCYDVGPTTPTVVTRSLYLRLNLYYGSSLDRILLYPVKATYVT